LIIAMMLISLRCRRYADADIAITLSAADTPLRH